MILLLGSGRSGTTWAAKLIDTNPDVFYLHEPDISHPNSELPFLPKTGETEKYAKDAAHYLEELVKGRSVRALGSRPVFQKNYRNSLQRQIFKLSIHIGKAFEKIPKVSNPKLPVFVNKKQFESAILLIKSVSSLCRAGIFIAARADLRIIHIARHPCGVIASHLRGIRLGRMSDSIYLKSAFGMPESRQYPFTIEEIKGRSAAEQMAYVWMIQNNKTYREMKMHPHYRFVRYEDLCTDTAGCLEELYNFAGLAVDEQTRDFLDNLQRMNTDSSSYFSVLRSPLSALHKWREELDKETQDNICEIVSHSEIGRLFTHTK